MTDRLIAVFADVLGLEAETLNERTSPTNTPAWDSVSHILLIAAIEASFALQLTTADIESMRSIGDTRAVIERRALGDEAGVMSP